MADSAGNHFGPLDIVANPDAEDYTESTFYRFDKTSGVLSGGGLTTNGLTATLAPVDARVQGGFFYRTEAIAKTSPPTAGANPRRDLLVLRSKLTSGSGETAVGGTTVPVLLQGTPAATPVDPDPEARDEPLWSWMVPGSGGSAITDVRDRRVFLDRDGNRRKPRARLYSTLTNVPGVGQLFGIGSGASLNYVPGNDGDSVFAKIQDGLQVAAGIYAVTFNARLQGGAGISGRSLLDIVGNTDNDTLSRSAFSGAGEDRATNSTTLFLPAAQKVRFITYINSPTNPLTVTHNVDITRLGDF